MLIGFVSMFSFGANFAHAAPTSTFGVTFLPNITDTYDLGSVTYEWNNLYVHNIHCTGTGCSSSGGSGVGTIATSSLETKGQLPYYTTTSGYPALVGSVATSSVTNGTGISFSGTPGALVNGTSLTITNSGVTSIVAGTNITISGATGAVTINASGGGGSGTVSTSTHETAGSLAYWTSNSGTPALLGQTSTTTLAGTGVISISNSPYVLGGTPAVASLTGGTGGYQLDWLNGVPTWQATSTVSNGTGINCSFNAVSNSQSCSFANISTNSVLTNQSSGNGIPIAEATSTFGNNLYGVGTGGQVLMEQSNGTPAWVATTSVISLTTTGTSGAATYTAGVLNIPNYTTGGSSFGYPFTNPTEYGTTTAATTTPLWAQEGIFASSTSVIASTTFAIGGNVGIKTLSPVDALDVTGSADVSSLFGVGCTVATDVSQTWTACIQSPASTQNIVSLVRPTNTVSNYMQFTPNGGNTTSNVNWIVGVNANSDNFSWADWNGSNTITRFTLTDTGNLGLGTTSPYALFSVGVGGDYASHALSTAFIISSSTAGTATTTLLSVNSAGLITTNLASGFVQSTAGVLSSAALTSGQVTTALGFTPGQGTVTAIGITTNQGVSGSSSGGATPNLTLTLGALTGVTSFNGLVVTANTGAITTGIWNGTTIGIANGGTNATTFIANTETFYNGSSLTSATSTSVSSVGDFGFGTTSSPWILDVATSSATATFDHGQFALTDTQAGLNLKHWLFSNENGDFFLSTSSDLYATSSQAILSIIPSATAQATTTFSNTDWLLKQTSPTAWQVADGFGTIDALLNTASTTGSIFTVAATTSPSIGAPIKLFDVDQYGHLTASSTPATPAISSCGTGSPVMGASANDDTGNFTTGTSATTCTITFGRAYATTPTVIISDSNTSAVVDVSSVSTTAFTISLASALSAVTVYYVVVQP